MKMATYQSNVSQQVNAAARSSFVGGSFRSNTTQPHFGRFTKGQHSKLNMTQDDNIMSQSDVNMLIANQQSASANVSAVK